MNGTNDNTFQPGTSNLTVRPKSLTPSVLGVANSHGVKLSVNMTSEDKKELMSKLEEWRNARKEKLAARILSKHKPLDKPKPSTPATVPKNKLSLSVDAAPKIQDRQSVFDRLYNDATSKIKKSDVSVSSHKPPLFTKTTFGKLSYRPSEKPKDSVQETHTNVVEKNVTETIAEKPLSAIITVNESEASPIEKKPEEILEAKTVESVSSPKTNHQTGNIETDVDECKSFHKNDLVLKNLAAKPPVKPVETGKPKNPLRRSISMMFRQKRKSEFPVRRSVSAKNLKELDLSHQLNRPSVRSVPPLVNNIGKDGKNDVNGKSVSFVTPKSNKSGGSSHLRTKLENWLKVNGHSLEKYRHLRCFDISHGDKSQTPVAAPRTVYLSGNSNHTSAPDTPANDSDKENVTPVNVVQKVDPKEMENWLKELHRLIVELKYPSERCEEWLAAIRRKCNSCTQLPIYWECLAALNESKGDLKSAVEDYETAIIKGGEVDSVGESLAQLFEKMVIEQQQHPKPKLEKGIDPKNIFKSTIIKFALQQKALKKLSSELDPEVRRQLYVATPVRRSTRIQTPYKSKGEVASLQSLTPELRENVIFKPNDSLIRGD